MTPTRAQLIALRDATKTHGPKSLHRAAKRALRGDPDALDACADAIDDTRPSAAAKKPTTRNPPRRGRFFVDFEPVEDDR